jgi:AcrR family transcriptional regulator
MPKSVTLGWTAEPNGLTMRLDWAVYDGGTGPGGRSIVPRPRFLNLAPERRRHILETAAVQFSEHGFRHASLNHVIETLGISKGVFYYYFDSKADLFGAVVDLVWDLVLPGNIFDLAALDATTYWPRVEALLRDAFALLGANPWLAGISRMVANPPRRAGIDKVMAEKLALGHAWMEALVRRGQELGAVRRDVPMQWLLAVLAGADQASDRWVMDHWSELSAEEREQMCGHLFNVWRRIAEPAGSGAGGQRP